MIQKNDEYFMYQALQEAKKAYEQEEVPVGAVLVFKGRIIARGHNQIEMLKDATAHAEMLCIGAGAQALNNWRLLDTTLYCTLEPCVMCAGALLLSRVATLVWGGKDIRHGANGSWIDLFTYQHPTHKLEIRSGILEADCTGILKDFFIKRRYEN
ncbi:MAG: tRNA adenosine(34) deaminase TadA [Chlamydiales bacterium]